MTHTLNIRLVEILLLYYYGNPKHLSSKNEKHAIRHHHLRTTNLELSLYQHCA